MKHGSLFSGIGGFDLAAEWMGWENVFHCEWNEFGKKVLKHYWPNSISYHDITKTDFTIHRGNIDLLTGGFPCQPYSTAGKRLGKADDRHLWPEMLRAIREIEPTWIVGENVRGLLSWNGGMVFDEVQADLEACGYEVLPFLLPACAVNAPHRRDRVWFVAHSANARPKSMRESEKYDHQFGITPDTCQIGLSSAKSVGELGGKQRLALNHEQKFWEKFPTQSPICFGDDGLPTGLDGITFPKWRNESIKAGGNAIVPHVAYQIFKAIQMLNQ